MGKTDCSERVQKTTQTSDCAGRFGDDGENLGRKIREEN